MDNLFTGDQMFMDEINDLDGEVNDWDNLEEEEGDSEEEYYKVVLQHC